MDEGPPGDDANGRATTLETFIKENYEALTLAGIFSGVSVYLTQLTEVVGEPIQTGIAGALLVTVLLFLVVMKNAYLELTPAIHKQQVGTLVGLTVILGGLAGIFSSVISVMTKYGTGSQNILDPISAAVVVVLYPIFFEFESEFNFPDNHRVSEAIQQNAPLGAIISGSGHAIWLYSESGNWIFIADDGLVLSTILLIVVIHLGHVVMLQLLGNILRGVENRLPDRLTPVDWKSEPR